MLAAAKINLDLRITGRRDDGYHHLDSIVVFTDVGDEVYAEKSDELSLEISGPFADGFKTTDGNLILQAAKTLCHEANVEPTIKFRLVKNLPLSSGIGGGSSDGAAAMKLVQDILNLKIDEKKLNEIALKIGADVPVCLRSKASHMCGIGDELNDIKLAPGIHMLLVNPGISVSTPEIFRKYAASNVSFDKKRQPFTGQIHLPLMIDILKSSRNSLQQAACSINNEISDVLIALGNTDGALLSRMSGSGATCYSLYENFDQCVVAAKKISELNKKWWVKEAIIS
ncbi:MAG: 4-(cytidine 5'-diphospho)-2-C-methyl-D-erythritol kinase [Emcibacteraceae bacterium]|nr:4-(cytidine 5'-diphospho)-2-C-methyl-D-erythritol kinase [Emcibacteraceae bacterium]